MAARHGQWRNRPEPTSFLHDRARRQNLWISKHTFMVPVDERQLWLR